MTQSELDQLLDQAAERGARRALDQLGLHDDQAGADIRDLRGLIDSWRQARTTVFKTVTQWVTMGILGALAFGAWSQIRGK
jgi:hypothetical protein